MAKRATSAKILAEANANGPECVAKVLYTIEAESTTRPVHTDVSVGLNGEVRGDALAVCKT